MGVTQALAQQRLEFVSGDRDRGVGVISPLVLLPAEANPVPKKRCGKRDPRRPRSSSGSKIVFTLLTKVVAVYVRLSAVYVQEVSL